jgi:hypothetical protein
VRAGAKRQKSQQAKASETANRYLTLKRDLFQRGGKLESETENVAQSASNK